MSSKTWSTSSLPAMWPPSAKKPTSNSAPLSLPPLSDTKAPTP